MFTFLIKFIFVKNSLKKSFQFCRSWMWVIFAEQSMHFKLQNVTRSNKIEKKVLQLRNEYENKVENIMKQ